MTTRTSAGQTAPPQLRAELRISVTRGTGTGHTKLAAFDAALRKAGIANYNLIRLSSVIPPGATITAHDSDRTVPDRHGVWGDRLYVVLAECRVDTLNDQAWAGIGWVQEPGTGRGLFVEHEGHSRSQVEADINDSLRDLVAGRPKLKVGPVQMVVNGGTCVDRPLCSLVAATFEADPWRGEQVIDVR